MVFVMGGRGFVGSAFTRLLTRLNVPHEILEIDNYADFRGRECDVLINANGNSKKWLATKEPLAEFDASVRTVVDSLHSIRCRRYVLCSTCDVYTDVADPRNNHEGVALDPVRQSRYGFHKFQAENWVRYEAPDYLIVRFGGFVGPGLRKNPIFDLLSGGPLWLDPESRLQFLHTDRAAEIVWQLAQRAPARSTFNVCGDGLVRLRDAMTHAGADVPVQPDSPRVTYQINIDRLKQVCDVPATERAVFDFITAARAATAT